MKTKAKPKVRICLQCDKRFKDDSGKKHKFCSSKCADEYYEYIESIVGRERIKINEKGFSKLLEEHNKIIYFISQNIKRRLFIVEEGTYSKMFKNLGMQGKILCLINARFRCEKCGSEQNLTRHHLITRLFKNYMEFNRYLTQRYFWANSIILCKKHHKEIHSSEEGWDCDKDLEIINPDFINELKGKFLK